jgi:hypothetical protein
VNSDAAGCKGEAGRARASIALSNGGALVQTLMSEAGCASDGCSLDLTFSVVVATQPCPPPSPPPFTPPPSLPPPSPPPSPPPPNPPPSPLCGSGSFDSATLTSSLSGDLNRDDEFANIFAVLPGGGTVELLNGANNVCGSNECDSFITCPDVDVLPYIQPDGSLTLRYAFSPEVDSNVVGCNGEVRVNALITLSNGGALAQTLTSEAACTSSGCSLDLNFSVVVATQPYPPPSPPPSPPCGSDSFDLATLTSSLFGDLKGRDEFATISAVLPRGNTVELLNGANNVCGSTQCESFITCPDVDVLPYIQPDGSLTLRYAFSPAVNSDAAGCKGEAGRARASIALSNDGALVQRLTREAGCASDGCSLDLTFSIC